MSTFDFLRFFILVALLAGPRSTAATSPNSAAATATITHRVTPQRGVILPLEIREGERPERFRLRARSHQWTQHITQHWARQRSPFYTRAATEPSNSDTNAPSPWRRPDHQYNHQYTNQ
ncbi:hypothetical protein E2C01_081314 [Portunus trituberculatus]|uniref:Secreted protein n=1 Tax=Portunus trituberculatus TaxID=210409 RepID=A0A5B7J1Y9_PORTR|nr:hypothetical protein [Portunus trituberculatus]